MISNKYIFLAFVLLFGTISSHAQLKVGDKAPEIFITNWIKNIPESKNLKRKFTVIDFWATWCAPCLESVPHINELVKKNKNRPNMVFLSMTDEKTDKVNWLLKTVKFSSIVVADTTRKTFKDYQVSSIPLCVVIDEKNQIRWVGNPRNFNDEVIAKILQGKTVAPVENGKSSLPKEVKSKYDSLFNQYHKYYSDNNLKEYFTMEPLSKYKWGAYFYKGGNEFWKEEVVGDSLIQRFSELLKVADKQVTLPESLVGSCISYCYKSEKKNKRLDILDTLMHQLNLKYSVEDSVMNVLKLEVGDELVLKRFIVGSEPHGGNSSYSESYAAIYYVNFSDLIKPIERKFNTVIILKDKILDSKMSITIQIDNIPNLIKSFKANGIKATLTKKRLPVYHFFEKG